MIAVKARPPKLLAPLERSFDGAPLSINLQVEYSRNRDTERTLSVSSLAHLIDAAWVGLERVIRVERHGIRAGKPYAQTVFYLRSLCEDALRFAQHIRAHWHIENRLHWCKDVVLKEDTTPLCAGQALIHMASRRTFALNLLCQQGFASLTTAIRQVAHDVHRLFSFCP